MFNLIKQQVEKKFGSQAKTEGISIPGGSGALEVKVTPSTGTETLVHSKLNGEGRIDSKNVGGLIEKIAKLVN